MSYQNSKSERVAEVVEKKHVTFREPSRSFSEDELIIVEEEITELESDEDTQSHGGWREGNGGGGYDTWESACGSGGAVGEDQW